MTYYAALDVGLRAVALCIIDETGEVKLERSLPSEVNDIVDCLRGFGEEIACVGLEAGSLTQWLITGFGQRASSRSSWRPGTCKPPLPRCATRPIVTTRGG